MSIKQRAKRRCEMEEGPHLLPSLRGAPATKQSIFAAPWIASRSLSSGAHSRDPLARNDEAAAITGCSAFAGMTTFVPSVLALAAHEIKVAAFIGLQDGLVEQMRIAALGPFRRRRGWQRRAALLQFGGVDQEIDASLGDIEP